MIIDSSGKGCKVWKSEVIGPAVIVDTGSGSHVGSFRVDGTGSKQTNYTKICFIRKPNNTIRVLIDLCKFWGPWAHRVISNILVYGIILQCKPDISRSRISRNWIYRGRMLDPIFWRPRVRYFSRNRGNSLDPIRGRQFFAKSAHRDSLCSRFAGDNFSRNQLKPTCQCGLEHMLCDGQPR